jgi:hypothetical protein
MTVLHTAKALSLWAVVCWNVVFPVASLTSAWAGESQTAAANGTVSATHAGPAVARSSLADASSPLANGQGLLWRIEKPGIAPSHIFGTVHFSDPRVLALPAEVLEAFRQSKRVVLEVADLEALQRQVATTMILPEDRKLDDIVGTALFARIVQALSRHGFGEANLRNIKPWAIYVFLSLSDAEMKRALQGQPYLDQWFEREAQKLKKPVVGLEGLGEHLAVLDGMPDDLMVGVVEASLASAVDIDRTQEEVTELWLARDLDGLNRLLLRPAANLDPEKLAQFLDRLIDARNRRMAKRLKDILHRGNIFIAIGALHLPGDRGLVSLLAESGYTVTKVY